MIRDPLNLEVVAKLNSAFCSLHHHKHCSVARICIMVSKSAALMQGGELVRDLLNIEVVAKLNSAFCRLHHLKHCSHDASARQQCAQVGHIPEKG